MIVCSHCSHQNPSSAAQCEACGSVLVVEKNCPNCGAPVQENARFCGQCGFLLDTAPVASALSSASITDSAEFSLPSPELAIPDVSFETLSSPHSVEPSVVSTEEKIATEQPPLSVSSEVGSSDVEPMTELPPIDSEEKDPPQTTLQMPAAKLLHLQTNQLLELGDYQSTIRIGKPNERKMPDINVAGFPNGEVVSRIHATIHVEQGVYSIEDVGSANGTYLNGMALTPGTPYRLRTGDKICLGKGELVTFIFKI